MLLLSSAIHLAPVIFMNSALRTFTLLLLENLAEQEQVDFQFGRKKKMQDIISRDFSSF